MIAQDKKKKFDIIFWGHVNNGIDRFLPLIQELERKQVKCLLFWQNYDFIDGLSAAQIKIVQKYSINICDYSIFLGGNIFLRLVTLFIRLFRDVVKSKFLKNKFIGLRSKLLKVFINESFVRRIIIEFEPKICFFDNISLSEFCDYPYGSFFVKKICDEMNLRTFSISHGGTTHIPKSNIAHNSTLNYNRIYEPNVYEKEWDILMYKCREQDVLVLGDPRFDQGWKKQIKDLYSDVVFHNLKSIKKGNFIKVLYLATNLEQIYEEEAKYKNLEDVVKLTKAMKGFLLIKPHPRYRNEHIIRKLMKRNSFQEFCILDDDPLICYEDHVDLVISMGTSMLQDILPEGHYKVVIYDNLCDSLGMKNIFKDSFSYFDNYCSLFEYIKNRKLGDAPDPRKTEEVKCFCRKWVGGDSSLNGIIARITDDIKEELLLLSK
jgi:hypothetical protein